MGVYVKGLDMPKNCFDCEIFGLCSLKDRLEHIKDRNPDCPLIEIPTPHGRLIDEDALDKELRRKWNYGDNGVTIANAPTILEAEE